MFSIKRVDASDRVSKQSDDILWGILQDISRDDLCKSVNRVTATGSVPDWVYVRIYLYLSTQ